MEATASTRKPSIWYLSKKKIALEIRKDKYMIVYTYPERITNVKEITAIKQFARDKGLKLISIGHYFPWCDEVVVPTPFEVLAYFRDADYIVTDTFHGSIFSIKHNKPFGTIIRTMNNQKLKLNNKYLLNQPIKISYLLMVIQWKM